MKANKAHVRTQSTGSTGCVNTLSKASPPRLSSSSIVAVPLVVDWRNKEDTSIFRSRSTVGAFEIPHMFTIQRCNAFVESDNEDDAYAEVESNPSFWTTTRRRIRIFQQSHTTGTRNGPCSGWSACIAQGAINWLAFHVKGLLIPPVQVQPTPLQCCAVNPGSSQESTSCPVAKTPNQAYDPKPNRTCCISLSGASRPVVVYW